LSEAEVDQGGANAVSSAGRGAGRGILEYM